MIEPRRKQSLQHEGATCDASLHELVRQWIALQKVDVGSEEHADLAWAANQIAVLTWKEPDTAWEAILGILARDHSERVMENLAGGPLEDLLVKHGPDVIERVEAEAQRNPRFAGILGGVWKNAMDDAVWDRLQRAWTLNG